MFCLQNFFNLYLLLFSVLTKNYSLSEIEKDLYLDITNYMHGLISEDVAFIFKKSNLINLNKLINDFIEKINQKLKTINNYLNIENSIKNKNFKNLKHFVNITKENLQYDDYGFTTRLYDIQTISIRMKILKFLMNKNEILTFCTEKLYYKCCKLLIILSFIYEKKESVIESVIILLK